MAAVVGGGGVAVVAVVVEDGVCEVWSGKADEEEEEEVEEAPGRGGFWLGGWFCSEEKIAENDGRGCSVISGTLSYVSVSVAVAVGPEAGRAGGNNARAA